jgi:hypothetical protein
MDEQYRRSRLQFDWYNHLTTLSLVILGGIAGFMPERPLPSYGILAVALVASGGAVALNGSQRIASDKPQLVGWRNWLFGAGFAVPAISVGAGVFLGGHFLR